METNIEKEKRRKQSSNTFILALEAPFNANIESSLQTSQKKKKKKKHKTMENNSPVQKLPVIGNLGEQDLKELEHMEIKTEKEKNRKQSVDEKFEVSNSDDLALKTLVNGNIETCLQTTENSIEGGSTQNKKKKKKKKHKAAENISLVQKLPEVGDLGGQGLKESEEIKTEKEDRKQWVDENFEVSNSDDLALKTQVNGNIEMCFQTADSNFEEGSGQKKKRRKKKQKAFENNSPVQKLLEVGNLGKQDRKELKAMEIDIVKEKNIKNSVDENWDILDTDYLSLKSPVNRSMETALKTAENNTEESLCRKKKRKKKMHKFVENNSPVQKLLEDGNLGEKDVRELEDVKINIEMENKGRHVLNENIDISNSDDLSLKSLVNRNVNLALQTEEKSTGVSSSWKKKRKENICKTVENNSPAKKPLEGVNLCEQFGKELEDVEISMDKEWKIKESLDESKVISKVAELATKPPIRNVEMDMQTTTNNAERSLRKKNNRTEKRCKAVENNEPVQELLESGNLCDRDLKHLEKANRKVPMGNTLIAEASESVDTYLKNNDKLAETSSINHGREKRRKRKKKGFSCSSASTTGPAYVMQTEQNSSVGEISVSYSDNLVSSKSELGNNRKNSKNEDELNEAQKSVGEHGISEERKLENLPNMLHGSSEKLEIDELEGPANSLMVVGSSPFRDVSVNCSDSTLVSEGNEGSIHVKKVNGTVHGSCVLKVEDMSLLKTTEENFVKENEDELNKIQKTVQDNEFSTYGDKEGKFSLETGSNIDYAAHILLDLRHEKCNSSESWKGHLNIQSLRGENISIGESSARGKRVKKKRKVHHALHESSVIKDDISVGATSKEGNHLEKLPPLPERSPCSTRKKLLIFDLNGLLADIVCDAPKGFKVDKKIAKKSLFKRTHCEEFLKFCFERFNVGVWSSRYKKNVDSVVDYLMKDMKHKLLFCWDLSHCTDTGFKTIENKHKPLVLKELKKLWDKHDPNLPWEMGEYNESNTLLVDDSPYKALCNPPYTAIFPESYTFRDTEDNSLGTGGDLRGYLEGLSMAEDVQKYVKKNPFGQCAITSKNPSWSFYSKALGAKVSEVQL